jgi:formylglycine-generating enzyme required for sulfatase activity
MSIIEFKTPTVDEKGEVIARTQHTAEQYVENLGNGIHLDMIIISAGIFQMGSSRQHGNTEEQPQHLVTIKSFMLGKFLVTQAQWKAVIGKLPACRFKGDRLPIEQVSWDAAQKFCEQLSNNTGRNYRLPSESQWEYACRAGSATPFSFGETLTTDVANFCGEHIYRHEPQGLYRHVTTEAGAFPPNAFGLHDMHGNLWEWCQDSWMDDYSSTPRDENSYEDHKNAYRVARGGSWHEPGENCRSAARVRFLASEADDFIGFRVSCDIR